MGDSKHWLFAVQDAFITFIGVPRCARNGRRSWRSRGWERGSRQRRPADENGRRDTGGAGAKTGAADGGQTSCDVMRRGAGRKVSLGFAQVVAPGNQEGRRDSRGAGTQITRSRRDQIGREGVEGGWGGKATLASNCTRISCSSLEKCVVQCATESFNECLLPKFMTLPRNINIWFPVLSVCGACKCRKQRVGLVKYWAL